MTRHDMKDKIVGYAYFPLFLNQQGAHFLQEEDADQYLFNQGSFQIPIYYKRPREDEEFTMQTIMALPKIQCATLLVRSYKCAQKNNKNLDLELNSNMKEDDLIDLGILRKPKGHYSSAVYNTDMC